MGRILALATCCSLFSATTNAGEPIFPDGTPASQQGGLVIIHQGDTTTTSLGGGLFTRRVRVTTRTSDGPVVTRFTMPPAPTFTFRRRSPNAHQL
jgi:hypothetical protein